MERWETQKWSIQEIVFLFICLFTYFKEEEGEEAKEGNKWNAKWKWSGRTKSISGAVEDTKVEDVGKVKKVFLTEGFIRLKWRRKQRKESK